MQGNHAALPFDVRKGSAFPTVRAILRGSAQWGAAPKISRERYR